MSEPEPALDFVPVDPDKLRMYVLAALRLLPPDEAAEVRASIAAGNAVTIHPDGPDGFMLSTGGVGFVGGLRKDVAPAPDAEYTGLQPMFSTSEGFEVLPDAPDDLSSLEQ